MQLIMKSRKITKTFFLVILVYLFILLAAFSAKAQIITTMAGTGAGGYTGAYTGGYSGDGGPATSAELYNPAGVAVDALGNVYFADPGNNVIRKVNTLGIIRTIAGNGTGGYSGDGGPATAAELTSSIGVAVDASGNIYIADNNNQVVRKINTAGIITTFAGNGFGAGGIAWAGGYSGDGGPATAAELDGPVSIAFDGVGNVYIAELYNNVIRKVNTAGIISTFAGNGFGAGVGSGPGSGGYTGDGGVATSAELHQPAGIAIDALGNVFIADQTNRVIRKVNTAGIISTIAGNGTITYSGDGGPATAAGIPFPNKLAFDGSGNLYIDDIGSSVIRVINTSGIIRRFAGNGTSSYSGDGGLATAAGLFSPGGVAVDASGNVYIGDERNNRIRVVSATGTVTTCSPPTGLAAGSITHSSAVISWVAATGSMGYEYIVNTTATAPTGSGTHTTATTFTATGLTASTAYYAHVRDSCGAGDFSAWEDVPFTTASALGVITAAYTNSSPEVFPNPNNGTFTVNLTAAITEQAQLVVTNLAGEKVKEITITTNHASGINLDVPEGVYFLSATTAHDVWNGKIVVTR